MVHVCKNRELYLYGQTRIHVDYIDVLVDFLELEVVLRTDQTKEEGMVIANDIMKKLELNEDDLVKESYMNLKLQHDIIGCKIRQIY